MVIKHLQIELLNKQMLNQFVNECFDFLKINCAEYIENSFFEKKETFELVLRCIKKAKRYNLDERESIKAFIALCCIMGENFLESNEYILYRERLITRYYDPNEYVFKIPILK